MTTAGLAPGSIFAGDFRIEGQLGAGGMGAVYVAEQLSTGKRRALKVMLPELVADPTLLRRFVQEARIGSRIESEHVVEVVSAGVDAPSGMPFLAMELLRGEDLAKLMARRECLSPLEVGTIFEQLCHALGAAHQASIVHRDLKPENIYLAQVKRAGASFAVKVLDFGIAKIVAEAKTKRTAPMGSPRWMAPEQTDQSPVTPATDVWALGLIAFHLLTGRFFWKTANREDTTLPQLLREVLFEPIPAASPRADELGARGRLPPRFDAWFERCVNRDPSARWPTATAAFEELGPALTTSAVAGTLRDPPPVAATVPDPALRSSVPQPAPTVVPMVVPTTPAAPAIPTAGPPVGPPGGRTDMASASTLAHAQGASVGPSAAPIGARTRAFVALAAAAVVVAGGGIVLWRVASRSATNVQPAAQSSMALPSAATTSSLPPPDVGAPPATSAAALPPLAPAASKPAAAPVAPPPAAARKPGIEGPAVSRPATGGNAAGGEPPRVEPVAQATATTTGPPLDDAERRVLQPNTPDAKMRFKQQMEQKVYSGHATDTEINLLIATCKELGDKACVAQARQIKAQRQDSPY